MPGQDLAVETEVVEILFPHHRLRLRLLLQRILVLEMVSDELWSEVFLLQVPAHCSPLAACW